MGDSNCTGSVERYPQLFKIRQYLIRDVFPADLVMGIPPFFEDQDPMSFLGWIYRGGQTGQSAPNHNNIVLPHVLKGMFLKWKSRPIWSGFLSINTVQFYYHDESSEVSSAICNQLSCLTGQILA